MYFKVFITQSWGKRLVQTENGVFRGALQKALHKIFL